jgi:hypothetical protein
LTTFAQPITQNFAFKIMTGRIALADLDLVSRGAIAPRAEIEICCFISGRRNEKTAAFLGDVSRTAGINAPEFCDRDFFSHPVES